MLLANNLVYLSSLIIVLNNLSGIPLITVNLLLHFLHDKNLRTFLFINAFCEFIVDNFLDFLIVGVPQIENLFVVGSCLVVLDVKLLLLQEGSADALEVVK